MSTAVSAVLPSARPAASPAARSRRAPRYVVVSAWAVPVMVLGQFAFLAGIPIALVVSASRREPRLAALRRPALLLAASWVVPLALWLLGPDRPTSLSKDISPVSVGVIVAASAFVLLTLHRRPRFRS